MVRFKDTAEVDCGCFARGGDDPFVWPDAHGMIPGCGKDS